MNATAKISQKPFALIYNKFFKAIACLVQVKTKGINFIKFNIKLTEMEEKWKKKKLAIPYKTYSEWVHFLNEFKTTDQIYVQSSSSSSSSSASVNWQRVLLQHISFWLFRCSCKSVCLSSLLMCIQSLLFFRLLSFFFVSFRKRGCFFVFFINIFPCIVYFWLLHCVCQPCPSIICCVIPFSKKQNL